MRLSKGAIAAAILLFLLAALAWRSIVDFDFGIHMAGGRWIVENARVPDKDPFTYTLSDRDYLAYHWLFQVGVFGIHRAFGVHGLTLARWGILLATALLIADLLRVRQCSALAGSIVGLAAILASEWRFTMRPELVSNLLAAATLWVLERRRQGRAAPLWLLPILQLVWVNTHVYALGWAIMAVYLVEDAVRKRSLRTPLFAWSAVALLALFANPYHYRAVLNPIQLATRMQPGNLFAQHITELASPLTIALQPRFPFSIDLQFCAYLLLLGLGAVAAGHHAWSRRWGDAALIGVFGFLSVLAIRNMTLYAVVAAPSVCVALDEFTAARLSRLRGLRPSGSPVTPGGLLLAATLGFAVLEAFRVVAGPFYVQDRRHDRFASGVCGECLGVGAADWLAARDLVGPGFNDHSMGSVLIWRDPARKVFIDGRNEVSDQEFFARYQAASDPAGWQRSQQAYGFEYAVLTHWILPALSAALVRDPGWKLAYVDGTAVVFVRADGPNGDLPPAELPAPVSPAERWRALRAIQVEGGRWASLRRWLWASEPAPGSDFRLGTFLIELGMLDAAERPLLAAVRRSPSFSETHNNLATLYHRSERWGAAYLAYTRLLELDPDNPRLASFAAALREHPAPDPPGPARR